MTTRHRYQFIGGVLAWSLATLFVFVLTGWFTYEVMFLVGLIGFLSVAKLTSPTHFQPWWRQRLRWPILLGIGLFLVIFVQTTLVTLEGV